MKQNGHRAEALRFPARDTEIGKIIDNYLKSTQHLSDHAIHLLFSANRWELNALIREKLESGITLVVDRYAFSGASYSHAKGLDLTWCKNPDKGLPRPDLVIFLDIDIEKSKKRGAFGSERYEKEEMQKQVRRIFLDMAKEEEESKYWKVLGADKSIDEIHEEILNYVLPVLNSVGSLPILNL